MTKIARCRLFAFGSVYFLTWFYFTALSSILLSFARHTATAEDKLGGSTVNINTPGQK